MRIKIIITFLLFNLAIGKTLSAVDPVKIEVICRQTYSQQKLEKLCPKKKCRWKILESSKRATSWQKRGQFKVIENPLVKGIKVELNNSKISGLKLPWCFGIETLNLPKRKILTGLLKSREVLYLLEKNDTIHLPRLRAIKHPCRILKEENSNIEGFKFYFLKKTDLKSC